MESLLYTPIYLDNLYYLFNRGVDNAWLFYATNPRTAFAILVGMIFVIYYLREVAKRPDFYSREGKLRWFILAHCTQLQERYWPTVWCFGTHAQTALANTIRGALPNLNYKRDVLTMSDGGQVSLDWYEAPRMNNDKFTDDNRPIAIFMPGLTGDSNTEYIKSLIPNAHNLGYRAVAFNNRGRGRMKLTTARLYCAADCSDVRAVFEYIKQKYPKAQIIATGVSLGGIVLCRYLIESGEESLVDAAMLVSIAYDLNIGAESMSRPGLNLALNQHLTRSLVRIIIEQKHIFHDYDKIDFHEVCKSTTLIEFDERFTKKMWGFASALDYYAEASCIGKLHKIKRPTLCISAADDMFAPLHSLPIKEIEESSHVCLIVTQRGGHIGFMEGLVPTLPFYSERLSKEYLAALIKLNSIRNDLL